MTDNKKETYYVVETINNEVSQVEAFESSSEAHNKAFKLVREQIDSADATNAEILEELEAHKTYGGGLNTDSPWNVSIINTEPESDPEMKHAPEPWSAFDDDGTGTPPGILSDKVNAGGNFYVAQFKNFNDAAHAAACVNACKGIPTKALVNADMKKLVDVAKACEHTYSDLADADDLTETDNETWGQLLSAILPFEQECKQ